MAQVHRARDLSNGQLVGLKWLRQAEDDAHSQSTQAADFLEREFHTLVQLAHPRIVKAFDYGVDPEYGPYYTMELLDGGDVRDLSPLPLEQACSLAYEACSALAFLHSRRLIHRDITPRNIRRTNDGQAKLIDFGLLSAFGPGGLIVGTPPYMAPEVVNLVALDGRCDLFALGGTLYFALTGRVAYPARRVQQLHDIWRSAPVPPSRLVAGIPRELDALVLELLRPNAGARPKNAAEVMDRLRPFVPSVPDELRTAQAYLSTPTLVERGQEVAVFRKGARKMLRVRGASLLIEGDSGTGRSRMLDAFVLEAKLVGASAARAGGLDGGARPFGVVRALVQQLASASPDAVGELGQRLPDIHDKLFSSPPAGETGRGGEIRHAVRDWVREGIDRDALQDALETWFGNLTHLRPLALAVDDLPLVDEPSASVLAAVAQSSGRKRLLCALAHARGATPLAPKAVDLLERHCQRLELRPLSGDGTAELLTSVFGNVPHVTLLAGRLHRLTGGNPRACLELAQHLVDRSLVTYEGGSWVIPRELPDDALPTSLGEAFGQRVAQLDPSARMLAELMALSLVGRVSLKHLGRIDGHDPGTWQRSVRELQMAQVITGDASGYALAHDEWRRAVCAALDAETAKARHRTLADMLGHDDNRVLAGHHRLKAGQPEEGFSLLCFSELPMAEALLALNQHARSLGTRYAAPALDHALTLAEQTKRSGRDLFLLRSIMVSQAALGEDIAHYHRAAGPLLAQARRDSGYDDWLLLTDEPDPMQRTLKAFGAAQARYDAMPEDERVNSPVDGIRALSLFVVTSIAVGTRSLEIELVRGLPELLEPFVPLSPIVAALQGNARATRMATHHIDLEGARAVWLEVIAALEQVEPDPINDQVRTAIYFAIGTMEARIGLPNADKWADKLDSDPHQAVNAEHIRRLAALQRGDLEAGQQHRERAELLMLRDNPRQMFAAPQAELTPLAIARDLTGLKEVCQRIEVLADRHPGWRPWLQAARAYQLRLRGAPEAALELANRTVEQLEHGIGERAPVPAWSLLTAIRAELLLDMGDPEAALRAADRALHSCRRYGFPTTEIERIRAQALGAGGQTRPALEALETLAEARQQAGVRGLLLGIIHETAARVALQGRDEDAFHRHAERAAEHYDAEHSALLSARYERLLDDARRSHLVSDQTGLGAIVSNNHTTQPGLSHIDTVMTGCEGPGERAARSLALLCEAAGAPMGHLFLIREGGLQRAASNAPDAFTEELTDMAREFLDAQVSEEVMTQTVSVALPERGATAIPTIWTTQDGVRYRALPLEGLDEGDDAIAGVVMLSMGNTPQTPGLPQLAAQLAAYLVGHGEARWQALD